MQRAVCKKLLSDYLNNRPHPCLVRWSDFLFIMSISLFPHQEKSVNEIIEKFKTNQRVLFQLSTGGGKTFCFSFLTKHWVNARPNEKVLILCHRKELIEQTFKSLNQIGVTCEIVTAGKKYLTHSCNAYICMVQTLSNRLDKNPDFLRNIGLIIVDECHNMSFNKLFPYFPNSKILGCTATPIVQKRITFFKCSHCKKKYDTIEQCCGDEVIEWSRPFTMSEIYNDIVIGASIKELIDLGNLVQEITFVKNYADTSKLKIDNIKGDFSNESLDIAYNEESALFNVVLNYEEICKGKKTMVFNSTTKSNALVYEKFKEAGHNVKLFDTVNNSDGRAGVVKWFRDTPDAILCNVGVFTTGFDVTDVEAIILNTSTKSLSLFLQMVGRGGRSTKKIYKENFIVIDGGNNTKEHSEWSDNSRDWRRIFFGGLEKEKEKSKKISLDNVQSCENEKCLYLFPKSIDICPECGTQITHKPPKEKIESDLITTPIRKIPPPNAEKIYLYCKSINEDLNFAFKIMVNQIFDLFRYYRISKDQYSANKSDGRLQKKIEKIVQQNYFTLKSKHDLNSGTERTLKYLYNKVYQKLDDYYEK